ncbi:hypothetical protein CABS01_15763 [Colletotrichum abscissum]|uniref:uncharacterized protein n=1 Tax=Colletotrichum abscissum TaxID=1671311 RepID=UPI0027D4DBAE|nr:uncharacterized protein CABS01_15763 [Colletotrichum abscissum]KAK1474539.1 hypothetical protein CABS01_15763 [Colletotrichum abscissum]
MATLDILRQTYKSQSRWFFNLRVCAMVCVLVLSTYTTAVVSDMDWHHGGGGTASAACLNPSSGISVLYAQYPLIPLLYLWSGYIFRLQNFYLKDQTGRGVAPLLNLMGRPSLLYKGALAWDMDQERAAAHQKRDALFDAKLRLECHRPGPFYKFAVKTFDDGATFNSRGPLFLLAPFDITKPDFQFFVCGESGHPTSLRQISRLNPGVHRYGIRSDRGSSPARTATDGSGKDTRGLKKYPLILRFHIINAR